MLGTLDSGGGLTLHSFEVATACVPWRPKLSILQFSGFEPLLDHHRRFAAVVGVVGLLYCFICLNELR